MDKGEARKEGAGRTGKEIKTNNKGSNRSEEENGDGLATLSENHQATSHVMLLSGIHKERDVWDVQR